jgi:hypothetical protein
VDAVLTVPDTVAVFCAPEIVTRADSACCTAAHAFDAVATNE